MGGRRWAAAVAAWILVGCGGGAAGPSDVAYDFSFDDPPGDTTIALPDGNPDQVKAIDLVRVSGGVTSDRITLVLELAEPVTPWTDRAANALDGFVFLDVDQDPATGATDDDHEGGADFYVDLRDNGSGRSGLVGVAGRTLELVPIAFDGTRVEIRIPRSALRLGTDGDNRLNLWVEISARRREPVADEGPETSHHVLEPPGA